MKSPHKLLDKVDQIGILVDNIETSMSTYSLIFGKPFEIREANVFRILDDGREIKLKGKAAFLQAGALSIELIEIVEDPEGYAKWMSEPGKEIHLGTVVNDFDAKFKEFKDQGFKLLHLGKSRMRYAYFDTKPFVVEIIEKVDDNS